MTLRPGHLAPAAAAIRTDANGTMWRLRSLIAMGHDCARIARALGVPPALVRRVVGGQARTVTCAFAAAADQLWDAWWDKTPPQQTAAERRAATRALRQAEARDWPAAAGLDEDELDTPGYRPWCRYRPASRDGTRAGLPPGTVPSPPHQGDRVTTTHYARRAAAAAAQTRKANRMTQHITAAPAARPRLADLARGAGRRLSGRMHTAADGRARARGWEITETPGPLGLRGRRYRDPRFGARRSHHDAAARRGGRHD